MKNRLFLILLFKYVYTIAQVGIGTTNPDLSSVLDIVSSDSGVLIPRLNQIQKNAILSPATGLLIYQTTGEEGFWYYEGTQWLPLKVTYEFSNGLTSLNNDVTLGGDLIKKTLIDLKDYNLNLYLSQIGEFIVSESSSGVDLNRLKVDKDGNTFFGTNTNSEALVVNADTDVVDFGFKQLAYDYVNNFAGMTDHTGMYFNVDYIASFDSGNYRGVGTTIGLGSIEYLTDGSYCTYFSNSIMPFHDVSYTESDGSLNYLNLGASTHRWNEIYTQNGVIQTSDKRLKTNVKQSDYGLKEIMLLNPVTYNWKKEVHSDFIKSSNIDPELKIGLIAQDVLKIIPEVVTTHSWRREGVDGVKESDMKLSYIENERMGMNYSELIPVLIKAIQEQEIKIQVLESKIK